MSSNCEVVVLMSTYNGKKYIEEQLLSIIEQDYAGCVNVYIRDDGSNDNIEQVIEDFKCKYESNTRKIVFDSCLNVGVQKSFLHLIQTAPEAEFYFFADQDDVWKKDKISRAVSILKKSNDDICVYCSDYTIVDNELNLVYEKQVLIDEKTFDPLRLLFFNTFPGCVMGFNNKMMHIVRNMNLSNCMMHDSMVLAVGAAIGTICYDDYSSILHRIHNDNVVGYGHKKIKVMKWIKEKTRLLIKKESYNVSEIGEKLLNIPDIQIKDEYQSDIELLRDYKKSYRKTFRLLRHRDLKRKLDRETLSIRCKVLFHIF